MLMTWKLWLLGFLKVLWAISLILFLVMSGWLLHILEGASRSITKSKKSFNKRAVGAGTIAVLVSKPINRYSLEGRKAIRGYLVGHYSPYGAYVSRIV